MQSDVIAIWVQNIKIANACVDYMHLLSKEEPSKYYSWVKTRYICFFCLFLYFCIGLAWKDEKKELRVSLRLILSGLAYCRCKLFLHQSACQKFKICQSIFIIAPLTLTFLGFNDIFAFMMPQDDVQYMLSFIILIIVILKRRAMSFKTLKQCHWNTAVIYITMDLSSSYN